jgi:glycosyltransferase involved in cell wall biosynthesis
MRQSIVEETTTADYAFRFDALPERVTFTRQIKIKGWLLHRRGLPTHGIRGIVRGILRRRSIYRARRKRSRPLIAAAYPDLPEAAQSGFLLVLELPVGPNEITIQVQDHDKIWRTIFATRVWAYPLTLIGRLGLPRVEEFFVNYLPQLLREDRQTVTAQVTPCLTVQSETSLNHNELQSFADRSDFTPAEIKAVDLFVTSKSNLFVREIAELLRAGFGAAGCEAQLLVDQIPTETTERRKIQIVVTPHEFFNLFLSYQLSWEKIQRLANQLFLLGTEQPESEWFDSNLVTAPHARAMLDIHLSGVAAYRARGLPCFHLPLGYDVLLEQRDALQKSERDVDVCVLAAMTDRREEFIAANAEFFAARNCHIRLVPIGFAKTEETRSYLTAPQRNGLLQQTKSLLNVHYSDLRYFEWHRALVAIANRCCLITETCEGFEPLIPGKHFVMAQADNLTTCCEYYLKREDERRAITEAAYNFVRGHLTQKQNCCAFLEQIEKTFPRQNNGEHSNLELQANTRATLAREPFPDALAKCLSQRPAALFLSALRKDVSNMFRPAKRMPAAAVKSFTDPVDTAQRITTLRIMRDGYIQRFDAQETARERGEATFRLFDNVRFDDSAPAISVIVTLYNYQTYIQECLKSLEDSNTAAIPGGIEIVIINDASTDDSLQQAMAWQRNSRHPVRIVDKWLNTGLADTRNLGLQLARAPYAFILDADNMVFPRALQELHKTIVRDNSAAAYSILCRFEGAHDNLQGLLSYFDWDPQMLVEHPYIDAMALFNRKKLIEIGGYDTELFKFGWFGWEDYDLWLRIANAKLGVSFVPNVLCLYRHHERAMSNATNLFELELVGRLFDKYCGLIETYSPKRRILGVTPLRFEEALKMHSQKREQTQIPVRLDVN